MIRLRGIGRQRLTCLFTSALVLVVAGLIDDSQHGMAAPSRPAEAWVLRKVAAGEDAYLTSAFPDRSDRVLSADFVRRLLTNKIPGLKVPPHGVRIHHAIVKERLNLNNEEIPYYVGMYHCTFEENVAFRYARFKASVSLGNSNFYGAVDFSFAAVAGKFEAENAQFLRQEVELEDEAGEFQDKVEFIDTQVGGLLLLDSTKFERPVILYGAKVNGFLGASDAHFLENTDFELMEVGRHAFFNRSVFERSVRFYRCKVGQNFEAMGAHFNGVHQVSFEGMSAYAAKFTPDPSKGAVVFKGPVRFYGLSTITNLELDHAVFHNEADLKTMQIKGQMLLTGTVFNGKADFWSSSVDGMLEATDAQFKSALFLTDMKTDIVQLKRTGTSSLIDISGFNYREVNPDGVANLRDIVYRATFDAGAYETLESYYRRVGNISEANSVYLSRRRRERSSLPYGFAWVGSLLFDGFVAYGRRPQQVLIPSFAVIAFGWWLFRPKNQMQARDEKDQSRRYNAFLYSLDLFLPVVDLRSASIWEPEASRRFARVWVIVHVIAGWVLVTIFLVAITGLVK